MSISVNKEERDFLEKGGALWCVRELPAAWQVVMLTWEAEETVDGPLPSEWHAVRLVYLLHDLSTPQTGFRIHHAIARPEGLWPAFCSPLK